MLDAFIIIVIIRIMGIYLACKICGEWSLQNLSLFVMVCF